MAVQPFITIRKSALVHYIIIASICFMMYTPYAESNTPIVAMLQQPYQQVQIGLQLSNIYYEEKNDDETFDVDTLDKETGSIPGVYWQFMKPFGPWVIGMGAYFKQGKLTYDGFLESSESTELTPFSNKSKQTVTSWFIHLGQLKLYPQKRLGLEPYIEFSFRRWHRGSIPVYWIGDVGVNGYTEAYTHYALRTGFSLEKLINPNNRIMLKADIGILNANMAADVPSSIDGISTISDDYDLGHHLTLRLQPTWYHQLSPHNSMQLGLTYTYFGYQASEVSEAGISEPRSFTHELTLNLGFGFDLFS